MAIADTITNVFLTYILWPSDFSQCLKHSFIDLHYIGSVVWADTVRELKLIVDRCDLQFMVQ